MFWEIKRAAQLSNYRRRLLHEQRLMDQHESQGAQRDLYLMLRAFRRSVEEELRLWLARARLRVERRGQGNDEETRRQLRQLKDDLKARFAAERGRLKALREKEEGLVGTMAGELAVCRDMEEAEASRMVVEAHHRRFQEEHSVQMQRKRLNEHINAWRAGFAGAAERVR
jgi:hypothetical protein